MLEEDFIVSRRGAGESDGELRDGQREEASTRHLRGAWRAHLRGFQVRDVNTKFLRASRKHLDVSILLR